MKNIFNERIKVLKTTMTQRYPRSLFKNELGGLSEDFVDAYKKEKQRLVLGGMCPMKVHKLLAKALKFH